VLACDVSAYNVATVLLNSHEQLKQLRDTYHVEADGAPSCRELEQGVTEYTFVFRSCGNCLPKRAELVVVQDLRPTYYDGAAVYTHRLKEQK
jgi:hypothetical protein